MKTIATPAAEPAFTIHDRGDESRFRFDESSEPVSTCVQRSTRRGRAGFTLPELLVAMTVLALLLLMLTELLNQVQKSWSYSENRISQFREARVGFDIITKNLSQAGLHTYYDYDRDDEGQVLDYKPQSELHFINGRAAELGLGTGTQTHALFFQAPLGFSERFNNLGTLYNGRGYFVQFGDDSAFKPSFVKASPKYRFRLMEFLPPAEENQVYNDGDEERYQNEDAVYDKWYKHNLSKHVHPLGDNIVALIVSPRKSLADAGSENATYSDLAPDYTYDSNSVAEKYVHQVPPLVRVTMIAIDETSAVQMENGTSAPDVITSALAGKFMTTTTYGKDLADVEEALRNSGVKYRVFSSMVAIRSSKWSTFIPEGSGT